MNANLPPLPTVARLYYTGLGARRYKRASTMSGPGEPLCFVSVATEHLRRQAAIHAAALAAQAAEVEALRADVETWKALYRRAINEANGLTNYVEDRPELTHAERKLESIEAAARAALKEQT